MNYQKNKKLKICKHVCLQLLPQVVHDIEGHTNMYQNPGEDFRQQVAHTNAQCMEVSLTLYKLICFEKKWPIKSSEISV